MEHFVDDDDGYLDWLVANPNGFVINTGRTPSAAYVMLHRADCGTINGSPAKGTTFTKDYSKLCGNRDELEAFASQLGGQAKPCERCLSERRTLQLRAVVGGKYRPLRDHLAGCAGTRIRMTFAEVEQLVGRLPDSAHRHRAWWGNNGSNVEAQAWLDAGWLVDSVNQAAREVVFVRDVTGRATRRKPVSDRRHSYVDAQFSVGIAARAGQLGLDSSKLVKLITELNENYSRGNAYAAHALLRAVLDHIPPLLGCADFKAAVSSYAWGRTDRSYARRLLDFKLQADDVLHRQISKKADLLDIDDMPPRAWINTVLQECADPHPV